MNKETVAACLHDALDQIEELVTDLENGTYEESGELAFLVNVSQILNYLNSAWNLREYSIQEIDALSQHDYELAAFNFPPIDNRFRLPLKAESGK